MSAAMLRAGACALALAMMTAASAGAESGPITFSGDTRMGLVWSDPTPDPLSARESAGFRFESRARIRLNWEQQTDSGLSFGGQVDLDRAGRRTAPSASVTFGR